MEGVSHEAASFAGHQQLDNLCWIYDNNHISIDGRHRDHLRATTSASASRPTAGTSTRVADANDFNEITRAFDAFKATEDRPTLIIVDSHIGYGSPHKQDTAAAHGEPLGDEEVRETKRFYGWPEDAQFLVPDGVRERFAEGVGARGAAAARGVGAAAGQLRARAPVARAPDRRDAAARAARRLGPRHPVVRRRREGDRDPQGLEPGPERDRRERARGCSAARPTSPTRPRCASTRRSAAATSSPTTAPGASSTSGSASTSRRRSRTGSRSRSCAPSWSTYLTFSDYARPAIRLSALMELPVIHIFTHDSIGLGEDGPTHQPVEQLASLRAIPGLNVIRPCDANEVAEAWRVAIDRTHGPVALVLTRQNVPVLDRSKYASGRGPAPRRLRARRRRRRRPGADPDRDRQRGRARGRGAREAGRRRGRLAGRQPAVVLPLRPPGPGVPRRACCRPAVTARISIEEASTLGWDRYVGPEGTKIGMHTFGSSAPLKDVLDEFGFTPGEGGRGGPKPARR